MGYSQTGEETVIMRCLRNYTHERKLLIDIGAYDGVKYSNTRALIDAGWGGILVEASPRNFAKLLDTSGGLERLTLVCAAMSTSKGFMRFNDTGDEYAKAEKTGAALLPCVTWEDVTSLMDGPFGLVSIDAEGMSTDLFLAMPLAAMCPWVVCVEHDGRHIEVAKHGMKHGYDIVYLDDNNIIMGKTVAIQ